MADDNEIAELRGEIEKLQAKNKELIAEVRKAKGTTNEEAAKLAAELDDARAEKVKLEAALKKANDGLSVAQKESADKLAAKSSALQKLIRDEGLIKALTSAGVKKEFLGPVSAYLRDRVEVDEEKGEAFVSDGTARKALPEFISSWATSEEGKNFIAAPASVGGGASGPGTSKPGAKSLSRVQFDALDSAAKFEFSTNGGTLTD